MSAFWTGAGGAAAISGATNLIGGLLNKDSGRDQRVWATWMDNRNYDRQRYMAQHSTGWQLDDVIDTARQNGIHALAALGTQSAAQYTPGNIPDGGFGGGSTKKALGDAMSSAVNTFFQAKDMKMREKRNDAEINLLEAQAKSYEDEARNTIVAPNMGTSAARVSGAGNSADVQNIKKIEDNPIDPMAYYHRSGPYKGRFVIPMSNGTWVTPAGMVPKEVLEAIGSETGAELNAILQDLGAKRISRPKQRDISRNPGDYLGQWKKHGGRWYQWTKNGWKQSKRSDERHLKP